MFRAMACMGCDNCLLKLELATFHTKPEVVSKSEDMCKNLEIYGMNCFRSVGDRLVGQGAVLVVGVAGAQGV